MLRSVSALVAAAAFVAGGYLAFHYPIGPGWVLAAYLLWVAATFARPALWIAVLPAVLPVIGFASWTGWLIFEEWDLLALGAAAGGYASLALRPPVDTGPSRLSGVTVALVGLYVVSELIALARGVADAGGLSFGFWQQYYDPLNSFRVMKGFAFALLLLPLLRVDVLRRGTRSMHALASGLAWGCGAAALAVVWERAAFPGLVNFSTDYRATGPFWEMHVGGAALDAFLVLTFPFALWQMLHRRRALTVAAGAVIVALAAYALLATFSRGVYLALPVAIAVLALSLWRRVAKAPGQTLSILVVKTVAIVAAAATLSFIVLRTGGYRALGAVLAVFAISLPIAGMIGRPRPRDVLAATGAGVLLSIAGLGVATLLHSGAYLAFAGACLACVWQVAPLRAPRGAAHPAIVPALFVWATLMAALVAFHWGGVAALRDTSIALAAIVALVVANARLKAPLVGPRWQERAVAVVTVTFVAAIVAVFSGGAYMGERFATGEADLEGRIQHWRLGLAMLDGPADWLLGQGLGRFPSQFLVHAGDSIFPGTYRLDSADGRSFLALSGPRYPTSFGDLFRVAQRVPAAAGAYVVFVNVRAAQPARLHVEICEKHLLYVGRCAIGTVDVPGSPAWERHRVPLSAPDLGQGPWYAPRLAFFSLAVETSGRVVELDDVSVIGPDGGDVIANGSFAAGMAHWFFTSDRQHLPWHHKNLWLGVLIDQGLLGLLAFVALTAVALWRVTLGAARFEPAAPYLAAALAGVFVVGGFDTMLDSTRVAFAFYLVVFAALALPPLRSSPRPDAQAGSQPGVDRAGSSRHDDAGRGPAMGD